MLVVDAEISQRLCVRDIPLGNTTTPKLLAIRAGTKRLADIDSQATNVCAATNVGTYL